MKQVQQNLQSGVTEVVDTPVPALAAKSLLIATTHSLVSVGTEKMLVDFGRGNLVQKARQQPDKVKQAFDKVRTDGLMPTVAAIQNKLDTPLTLGYCNVGRLIEQDSNLTGFTVGDRIASNGKHAGVVCVPHTLCAKIPDNVDDESATFTVMGAIALQGMRLTNPTLGETVVVTGLGLIGLLAVQLLRANGCRVLGIDFDPEKLALAEQFGAETVNLNAGQDPVAQAELLTAGRGVDAVLITASTKSNEPMSQAAQMCRKRGRVVLVGVVGLELSRADFYEKEISFQVSCSYGPGRYDTNYEQQGNDYPVGFVRWTEQRNFEAILQLMSSGSLNVEPLISHRFKLEDAPAAYELVSSGNPLGVLLQYPQEVVTQDSRTIALNSDPVTRAGKAVIGFIGAGNYASSVLVPAFANTSARLRTIASATGTSSVHVGNKHGFELATTDASELQADPDITAVVITTRHNSHTKWVVSALRAGKHVFVEKPLALTAAELAEITQVYEEQSREPSQPLLMVGFNRRYAPQVTTARRLLEQANQPATMIMTVNAGSIPTDHWTQDLAVGGGRILGEACHFVDLMRHLAGHPITDVKSTLMDSANADTATITLSFANGSMGTLHYLANGNKAIPKERLEIYCGGAVLQLDNFRSMKGYGWKNFRTQRLPRQDKGQKHCAKAFVEAIETGDSSHLIPLAELIEVTKACLQAAPHTAQ